VPRSSSAAGRRDTEGRFDGGRVDQADRPVKFAATGERQLCAAAQATVENDQCGVGVFDVPARARGVIGAIEFSQRLVSGDSSMHGFAPVRTPAVARGAELECGVQRTAIDLGLAAGKKW
jgi:hypothetical protein